MTAVDPLPTAPDRCTYCGCSTAHPGHTLDQCPLAERCTDCEAAPGARCEPGCSALASDDAP